jgi:hypothetical protein
MQKGVTTEDRIGCMNPRCRRTAPRGKYGDSEWLVCRNCWNTLPEAIRCAHKRLQKRSKKLDRLGNKPQFGETRSVQWKRILVIFERAEDKIFRAMKDFFVNPSEPAGLDHFLKEMGLDA